MAGVLRALVPLAVIGSIGASPQDFRKFKGQEHTVCGLVVQTAGAFKRHCDTALMLGAPLKQWKIAAVIPKSARSMMLKRPEAFLHDEICVNGTVIVEGKKPYILVDRPQQIEIKKPAPADGFGVGVVWPCDLGATVPKVLKEVQPRYTYAAFQARVEGVVELEIVVEPDGSVLEYRFIERLHPDLDAAAVAAVRQWRFTSPQLNQEPARMAVGIELTFVMR